MSRISNIKKLLEYSIKHNLKHIPSALSQYSYLKSVLPKLEYYTDNIVVGKPFGSQAYYMIWEDLSLITDQKLSYGVKHEELDFVTFSEETLGNALGVASGIELANGKRTYVNISDGALQMGSTQEAMAFIGHNKQDILLTIDVNGVQLTGATDDILGFNDRMIRKMFKIYKWKVFVVDFRGGHSITKQKLLIDKALHQNGPCVIICKTIKGKGVKEMQEDPVGWHYKELKRLDDVTICQRGTKAEVVEKFISSHGCKYNYDKVNFDGSHIKVEITCQKHGSFFQTPDSHIRGHGCKKCYTDTVGDRSRLTTKEFIERSSIAHNGKFDYSLVEYKNTHKKVKIICPEHGIFEQGPDSHMNSMSGCLKCAKENIYRGIPTYLYYIKIKNQFKIGVVQQKTSQDINGAINRRYIKEISDNIEIEILSSKLFKDGFDAYELETNIKSVYYNKLIYKQERILYGGHTETFTEDVLQGKDLNDITIK